MSKSRPSAPPQIDPAATARAQAASNRETATTQAQLNMLNQYTPQGSLEYSQSGTWADGTPRYTATQTLTPNQQRILDLQEQGNIGYGETGNQLLQNTRNTLASPLDFGQFGAMPTYDTAFRDAQRQALIARAQPQWDQRRQHLETQLANQGITPGSEAYRNAFQPFNQGYSDFLLSADMNAGNVAGAEFSRMLQGRNARINEAVMPRQLALNETAALLSGNQLQGPSFVNTPQTSVAPVDTSAALGLNQQNALMQQQMANASNSAMQGGLFGMGGAALGSRGFWDFVRGR